MTWSHGSFYWNELMTHDVERAKRFYGNAIGWTFEAMPMGEMTYWVAKVGDQSVGGIFVMKGPDFANMPEQWIPYVAVTDVDAWFKKSTAAGATEMRAPFDIPMVGRMSILRAPGGAIIAAITPAA
jgi:predicted enzyme related to lactoylglutathione lyase